MPTLTKKFVDVTKKILVDLELDNEDLDKEKSAC